MRESWWSRLRRGLSGSPVVAAVLLDGPVVTAEPKSIMRRIAAEALIRQDEAERVLGFVRGHAPLGEVAPMAGPLVRRFFALRDELPSCRTPDDQRIRRTLDVILHHHAMVTSTALDLLAYEWRSERIARQVETFDGLGAPARLLDELYTELCAGQAGQHEAAPLNSPTDRG